MWIEDKIERDALISDIIALGKNYKFYKYTNAQLWNIKMKLIAKQRKELEEAKNNLLEIKKQQEEDKKVISKNRFIEVLGNDNISYFQDNNTGQLSFFEYTDEEILKLSKKRK